MSSDADPAEESTIDAQDHLRSLRNTVDHLEAVANVPPKQRHTSVSDLARSIASDAYDGGIPIDILDQLIDVITKPNHLDQGTITTLVKNLYSLEKISSNIVTKVVCSLGPSKLKPSPATQTLLVRWLLLVYDRLEDPSHLLKLYSVLFNLLDMISLRRSLCHLLSLITRRRHVKPFRIQALMELLRSAGDDEKEVVGFLRVFKNYYPDIIVGEVGRSRFFFKNPDPEWCAHLKQLQDRNRETVLSLTTSNTFLVARRGGVKRSKVEAVIPEVQTSRVQADHTSLEELRNVNEFVECLEKIELPNQMVSVLGDRLAQKYMLLVGPTTAKLRLEDWLEVFLRDLVEHTRTSDSEDLETLGYVLSVASGYARVTKQLPDAIQAFLKTYLRRWNGRDNREEILVLLQFLPRSQYEKLREDYLEPLENAILDHTASSRSTLLNLYARLIRQWGTSLRAEGPSFSPDGFTPLISLITHAEYLSLSLMEFPISAGDEASKPIATTVIEFYTTLAELYSHAANNGNIRLTVPLAPTVYILTFTSNLAQISLLCSVLATYKSSFEASLVSTTLQSPVKSVGGFYATEMVGLFNGYIMDLCNLIWRNRALNSEDPNALGCRIPAPTKTALNEYVNDSNETLKLRRKRSDGGPAFHYSLQAMLSLSHHPALADHSAACFATFEEMNIQTDEGEETARLRKPVTQKNLTALDKDGGVKINWQDYRLKMLDWFDENGSEGIGRLMRSTMKALRKSI